MIELHMPLLLRHVDMLGVLLRDAEKYGTKQPRPKRRDAFSDRLVEIELYLRRYEIDIAPYTSRIRTKLGNYRQLKPLLATLVSELRTYVHFELAKHQFMFIPSAQAAHFNHHALFGQDVAKKFPTANKEITEAGNCYAMGLHTACVFHLMRAVEIGAKAMAVAMKAQKYLGTTVWVKGVKTFKKRPVELCDWQALIGGLRTALNELEKGAATSKRKKDTHAYYSEAIADFSLFKDAWRNRFSHGHDIVPDRKLYLPGEASDVMNSTRQFMQHLASRLKE
jgi:hypothetical protein